MILGCVYLIHHLGAPPKISDFDSQHNSGSTELKRKIKISGKDDFREDLIEGRPVAKHM